MKISILDYKKSKAPTNTTTHDLMTLCRDTDNIYETVSIIGKRANQISVELKNDITKKQADISTYNDSIEEVFENREQIEISCYYEKMPKPTLIATQEYQDGQVYYRDPQAQMVDYDY